MTIYPATTGNGAVQIRPQAVPTSTTVVAASDSYITGITVINPTAGALTMLLTSREAVPVPLLPTVSIAANTAYVVDIPYGHLMVNGFTVIASGVGLIFYATWSQ